MKKTILLMLFMASLLTLSASCSHSAATSSETAADSVAPGNISQAPKPEGTVSCHVVNGTYNDAVAVLSLEGTEGTITASMDGEQWDTLYDLRLVSYKETDREELVNEEEGAHEVSTYGRLVVNAYDPKTGNYAGQFSGEFDETIAYDTEGEQVYGSQSYVGKFTRADGTVEDIEFYGD